MIKNVSLKIFRTFCLAAFLSFASGVYAQNSAVSSDFNAAESQQDVQTFTSSGSDSGNPVPYWSTETSVNQTKTPSTAGMFVKMIISILVVIGISYLLIRFIKRSGGIADADESFLRRVASISVGSGKTVQIITLLDKAYLVGVSDSSINLISEINDKELVESLNLVADQNSASGKPRSFGEVLDIFVGGKAKSGSAYGDSLSFTESLRKQRNRINREE